MLYTLVTEPFYHFCSASTGLKRSHPANQRSNFIGITHWLLHYVTLLTDKHATDRRGRCQYPAFAANKYAGFDNAARHRCRHFTMRQNNIGRYYKVQQTSDDLL